MNKELKELAEISREYGTSSKWVIAGGGNTSFKNNEHIYIKASGFPLAAISEDGFACMDRKKLSAIWNTNYPSGTDKKSVDEREQLVLQDIMNARIQGEEKRPSVETLLHDLLPWPFTVHLHPTLINGLTCSVNGKEIAEDLFGDTQVWIPVTNPGYVLAKKIKDILDERKKSGGAFPDYIFLANHGVFAGGENIGEVREKYSRLENILENQTSKKPGPPPVEREAPDHALKAVKIISGISPNNLSYTFTAGNELDKYLINESAASPLKGSLTPDHIVYSGPGALYLEADNTNYNADKKIREYSRFWGKTPNIILYGGESSVKGALVTASGEKALKNALQLFINALEVISYSENFGGPEFMEEEFVRFIVEWEVENYRSKVTS
jgi:rhamnose utilization protein RhaD (predicted bifunctional aldolase and dehydrogenase)